MPRIHYNPHHCPRHGPDAGGLEDRETLELGSKQEKTGEHLRTHNSWQGEAKERSAQRRQTSALWKAASCSKPHAHPDLEGEAGGGGGSCEKGKSACEGEISRAANMPPAPTPPQPPNSSPDNCHQSEDNSIRASSVSLTGWGCNESSVQRDPLGLPWRPAV